MKSRITRIVLHRVPCDGRRRPGRSVSRHRPAPFFSYPCQFVEDRGCSGVWDFMEGLGFSSESASKEDVCRHRCAGQTTLTFEWSSEFDDDLAPIGAPHDVATRPNESRPKCSKRGSSISPREQDQCSADGDRQITIGEQEGPSQTQMQRFRAEGLSRAAREPSDEKRQKVVGRERNTKIDALVSAVEDRISEAHRTPEEELVLAELERVEGVVGAW